VGGSRPLPRRLPVVRRHDLRARRRSSDPGVAVLRTGLRSAGVAQALRRCGIGGELVTMGSAAGGSDTRDVIARYVKAVHDQDYDTLATLQHPDFVEDWPQSRERIRGRSNLRRIMESYPGGLQGAEADVTMDRVIGGEDHWMVAPTFSMVRVSGADDVHTAIVKLRYPD